MAMTAAGGAWNLLPALALPFGIHDWDDFSEAVFRAELKLDPAGAAAQNWFSAWIFGLFAYAASAAVVLWQLRLESGARRLGAEKRILPRDRTGPVWTSQLYSSFDSRRAHPRCSRIACTATNVPPHHSVHDPAPTPLPTRPKIPCRRWRSKSRALR
jgi:hypothetical protein